jgi:dethiobiotin synthase
LLGRGFTVAALKPFCSGGRSDALEQRSALDGALTLDEINPWAFRAPVTPLLAARLEGKRVRLAEALAYLRTFQLEGLNSSRVRPTGTRPSARRSHRHYDFVLIEGAGGLLSPLGEGFNARDLIVRLNATPLIVCPNRLGAVNQTLLTIGALPRRAAEKACVILMPPRRAGSASRTNPKLLIEFLGAPRVLVFPRLNANRGLDAVFREPRIRRSLEVLVRRLVR